MIDIRLARAFGRADVDEFLHELSVEQYLEQLQFEEQWLRLENSPSTS